MSLTKAVITVNNPLLKEKYLGITIGERILLSLLYGGIRKVIVPSSFNTEILNKRKMGFNYSVTHRENPAIDEETLVIDTVAILNYVFIAQLIKNYTHTMPCNLSSLKTPEDPFALFIPVNTKKDLQNATPFVRKSLCKRQDTLLAFLFNRKLSTRMTAFFSAFKFISPNIISIICLAMGLYSGILLFMSTNYTSGVIAGVTMYVGSLLDGVDGELARVTYRFSKFGLWLDNITDEFLNLLLIGSTCMYSYHITGQKLFLYFCFWGVSLFILGKVIQYITVFLKIQPEDISQYKLPVFNKKNTFNKIASFLVKYLEFIPRADMMKFMLMITGIFAILPIYAYGVFIFSGVFFIGVLISTFQVIKKTYF